MRGLFHNALYEKDAPTLDSTDAENRETNHAMRHIQDSLKAEGETDAYSGLAKAIERGWVADLGDGVYQVTDEGFRHAWSVCRG